MVASTFDLDDDNLPDAGGKTRLKTLGDLDGRTNAAKTTKALIADLESDLGGASNMSAGERAVVNRAAVATAMIEDMEVRWLSGRPMDVAAYCSLVNVQRRLLTTVGLERRTKDITPALADYVAARTVEVLPAPPPCPVPLPPS